MSEFPILVPTFAKSIIDPVIINDEGGWKLTSYKNDDDGGWTFAGVTSKVFNAHLDNTFPGSSGILTPTDMAHYIAFDLDRAKQIIYEIYYSEYYEPVADYISSPTPVPKLMRTEYLSCAVNCGVEGFKIIYDRSRTLDIPSPFLAAWHYHYFKIVRDNAEAWRDYALKLPEALKDVQPLKEPKFFFAADLDGWFNRVERYR